MSVFSDLAVCRIKLPVFDFFKFLNNFKKLAFPLPNLTVLQNLILSLICTL